MLIQSFLIYNWVHWVKVPQTISMERKPDVPIWVSQWPIHSTKLEAPRNLAGEQLRLGHIGTSFPSWRSLNFIIKKSAGIWRLLIFGPQFSSGFISNMKTMVPSPGTIPRDFPVVIVEVKDCFYIFIYSQKKDKYFLFHFLFLI